MKQMTLPLDITQKPPRRETARLYGSVMSLRRRGYRVLRAGALHLVNGKQLTAHELVRFAEGVR